MMRCEGVGRYRVEEIQHSLILTSQRPMDINSIIGGGGGVIFIFTDIIHKLIYSCF